MTKFRAVQDGFVHGQLISKGSTFEGFEGFKPNWAVEVDDEHEVNASNSGEQESLSQNIAPALPELDRVDAPLAQFHPAVAVAPGKATETDDALAAVNADGTETPVVRTADTTSTSDPAQARPSRKRPQRADADPVLATGTEPSPAEKEEAEDASHAEVEGQKAADAADKSDLI